MGWGHRIVLVVWVCYLTTLTGCDSNGILSSEDRINAAVPVAESVQSLIAAARGSTLVSRDARSRFDRQLAARLKIRALTCAVGYEPKWWESAQRVKARLHGSACFADEDRRIGRWVAVSRIGWLIAAPALRPIPAEAPKSLMAPEFVQAVHFARSAGIATIETATGLYVQDIGTSEVLTRTTRNPDPSGALSVNGRVFVYGGINGAELRDSVSGATLLELPGVRPFQFHWLDARRAVYSIQETAARKMIDFQTGEETSLEVIRGTVDRAFPAPGGQDEYILLSSSAVTRLGFAPEGDNPEARVLDERPCPACNWALNTGDLTADGHTYAQIQHGNLMFAGLSPIEIESVELAPITGTVLTVTADPDKFLLGGIVRGDPGYKHFIYSRRDRTLAPLDEDGTSNRRFQYCASLRKVAQITASRVLFMDLPNSSSAVSLEDYLSSVRERANAEKLAAFDSAQRGLSTNKTASSHPLLSGLADGTRIDAVGVYEGAHSSRGGTSAGHRGGAVTVIVRKSSHPVVLVLSSYEGVAWTIVRSPGAQVHAILKSSYTESTVTGQGDVPVYSIGKAHAYSDTSPDFRALKEEVAQWTGTGINTFQGRYTATTYTVGGDD